METIANRIIKVVNATGGNKSEFARKVNLTPAYISKLDREPNRTPSDRTIADICREFSVSEHWLRTGEGEMFLQLSDDADFIQIMTEIQVSDDDFIKALLKSYWKLNESEKAAIRKLVDGMIEENKKAGE